MFGSDGGTWYLQRRTENNNDILLLLQVVELPPQRVGRRRGSLGDLHRELRNLRLGAHARPLQQLRDGLLYVAARGRVLTLGDELQDGLEVLRNLREVAFPCRSFQR